MTQPELSKTKQIPLAGGKFAIVDDDVYEELSRYKWHLSTKGYAARGKTTTHKSRLMHRIINNTPDGLVTDHLNGDTLDNRRANLRSCTQAENTRNRKGTKGYYFHKRSGKWLAQAWRENGRPIHLGCYTTEAGAAKAYRNYKSGKALDVKHRSDRKLPTGVSWHKSTGKFQAQITVNSKKKYVGIFKTVREAEKALRAFKLGVNP